MPPLLAMHGLYPSVYVADADDLEYDSRSTLSERDIDALDPELESWIRSEAAKRPEVRAVERMKEVKHMRERIGYWLMAGY